MTNPHPVWSSPPLEASHLFLASRLGSPQEPSMLAADPQLDRIERMLAELLELERSRQLWADYERLTAEWRARGGP